MHICFAKEEELGYFNVFFCLTIRNVKQIKYVFSYYCPSILYRTYLFHKQSIETEFITTQPESQSWDGPF